jgi:hypothetical protein
MSDGAVLMMVGVCGPVIAVGATVEANSSGVAVVSMEEKLHPMRNKIPVIRMLNTRNPGTPFSCRANKNPFSRQA